MNYLVLYILLLSLPASSQNLKQKITSWLSNYERQDARISPPKLSSVNVDEKRKEIEVYLTDGFQEQHFTPQVVDSIYARIRSFLPHDQKHYKLSVITENHLIEDLVPLFYREKKKDASRLLSIHYKGEPWVRNQSRLYTAPRGLEGTHISLWQSHGSYYKPEKGEWKWQRPRLFCTCEDLLTQTFVVPYIIPMLQNAGAIVFTPRERDWQKNEVIVDNDRSPFSSGSYIESYSQKKTKTNWQTASEHGFAYNRETYTTSDSPFLDGTARYIQTVNKSRPTANAIWAPDIPEDGRYAVYVTYHSYENSATDAEYIVRHNGGETHFTVNQQIGGGTWVYLGTFEFNAGMRDTGMVILTNKSSSSKSIVSADAVRFGGGMGNISQSATVYGSSPTSNLPRWAEAAKYAAVWYGFPSSVHTDAFGTDDYKNDINSRSAAVNYLSRGSVFNPLKDDGRTGLGVPLELNVAFHSDAGFKTDNSLVGSLAVYKTDFNNGVTGAGVDRYTSRDLASMFLTELTRDLKRYNWTVRKLWNRDYGEAREPMSPCCILEMLSHQNFADMQLAYDPMFRFHFSRSVYKTIVKYLATLHQRPYTIQPLPVSDLSVSLHRTSKSTTATLTWEPTADLNEPTAAPDHYIVYTRIGNLDFDNGTLVKGTSFTLPLSPDIPYSFRVTAVNKGGESFPSETLSAGCTANSMGKILVINGFNRLSGPASIDNERTQGFDLDQDPGVPYGLFAGYCGRQTGWNKSKIGKETGDGLGVSGSELEGKLFMGNTFDYTTIHGRAILLAGYDYCSTSESALDSQLKHLNSYYAIDIYYGVQKNFDPKTDAILKKYLQTGGRVIKSGANISDRKITSYTISEVSGCDLTFNIYREMNDTFYAVPSPSILQPGNSEFAMMTYSNGEVAATASNTKGEKIIKLGFPFEAIISQNTINKLMGAFLAFLK